MEPPATPTQQPLESSTTRREALAMGAAALAAGVAVAAQQPAASTPVTARTPAAAPLAASARPGLTLFSRHLQWTGIEEAVDVCAEAGFGGIAWTVRPGAHIEPERVAVDLPRAVERAHRAGLGTPLIVTGITDADSPQAEAILATAASLGIHGYRAGSYRYDFAGDVPAQLEALRPRVAKLATLNERLGTTALFHTQSAGGSVGGAVWDLWLLLRDFDPAHVAINYDTGHAMVKGGSAWLESARFARRHIRALSVKDFLWRPRAQSAGPATPGAPSPWPWVAEFCVPGQGMVNFRDMFAEFHSGGFKGPMEMHFEYRVSVAGRTEPVGLLGTDVGRWQLEMPKRDFVALLSRDVAFYAGLLRASGLSPALA